MSKQLTARHKCRLLLLVNGGIVLLAALFALAYRWAQAGGLPLFDCLVRQRVGIYCPACGGSRAVMCLWRLDLFGALRYYPPLLLCVLWIAELDVRLLADILGRTDRCMRSYRSRWRWLAVAALVIVTWVVRTVCLFAFRIDLLGDLLG